MSVFFVAVIVVVCIGLLVFSGRHQVRDDMNTASLVRVLIGLVRLLIFGLVVLLVVVAALQLQVSSRNADIKSTKDTSVAAQNTSEQARQAAADAKQAVEEAIAQSRQGSGIDPSKIVASLDAINRIEVYLCGGPCPESK